MNEPINLPVLVLDWRDGMVLARYPSEKCAREEGWPNRHLYADSTIIDTSSVPEQMRDILTALIQRTWDRKPHREYLLTLITARDGEPGPWDARPIPKGVSKRVARALLEDVWWLRVPEGNRSCYPFPHAYDDRRTADARAAEVRSSTRRTRGERF